MLSSEFINLLDEAARTGLLDFREFWFNWLFVATIAVLVGVGLEGPEIFHEVIDALITVERRKPTWMVLAGLVGWLLIVGGVAGECVFEVFVSRVDGQIQTFDNIQLRATERQVVEATREAGTARSSAETAANAAFGAVTMARDTRREAESFDHQIAKAEEDAEKALARISDAVTKAETAADKADQISAKLSDRELTDAQVNNIGQLLAKFAGQEYTVMTYFDMRECLKIANRIHDSLQKAGWRYNKPNAIALFPGVSGVKIFLHPEADKPTKDAAESLLYDLMANGLAAELVTENPVNNPKHNRISLNIGTKPQ